MTFDKLACALPPRMLPGYRTFQILRTRIGAGG